MASMGNMSPITGAGLLHKPLFHLPDFTKNGTSPLPTFTSNQPGENFTSNAVANKVIGDLSAGFKNIFLPNPGKPVTKEDLVRYISQFSLYYVYIGLGVFVAAFFQVGL
jgi:hypothetical protein